MFWCFFWSGRREWSYTVWRHVIRAYGGAIVLLCMLALQIRIALWFNVWNANLLDMLSRATLYTEEELWWALAKIGIVGGSELVVFTATGYAKRFYTYWWRIAMTEVYAPQFHKLEHRIRGASQLIQGGTGEFANIVEELGWEFLRTVMILIAFVPILWSLSSNLQHGWFAWSGSFALVAACSGFGGMIISWFVGRKLPELEKVNQIAEAEFRENLRPDVWRDFFGRLTSNTYRLYIHLGYFDAWGTGYAKAVMIVPYALCIPHMVTGMITFAGMWIIVNAFGEVQAGISIILRNWPRITRLRSVCARLREMEVVLAEEVREETISVLLAAE